MPVTRRRLRGHDLALDLAPASPPGEPWKQLFRGGVETVHAITDIDQDDRGRQRLQQHTELIRQMFLLGRFGKTFVARAHQFAGKAVDTRLELSVGRRQSLRQLVEHAKGMLKLLEVLYPFRLWIAHAAESRFRCLPGTTSAKHVPS